MRRARERKTLAIGRKPPGRPVPRDHITFGCSRRRGARWFFLAPQQSHGRLRRGRTRAAEREAAFPFTITARSNSIARRSGVTLLTWLHADHEGAALGERDETSVHCGAAYR